MICPNCKSENNEGAKFCKKCGTPLKKKVVSHEKMIDSMSKDKSNNTTKIIIAALIVIVVVLAGAFIYLQTTGHSASNHQSGDAQSSVSNSQNSASDSGEAKTQQASQDSQPVQAKPTSTAMKIQGGSFSTGSELSDKTYAHIYLGPENAGKSVIVQIYYSRDGNLLNNGNMVPVTVDSSGYVDLSSADAYSYYPDYAEIKLYDSNSKLLDTQSVSLSPTSGTQNF